MADTKYPVTSRTDVLPAPLPAFKPKKAPDGWGDNPTTPMNKPNSPLKDHQPTSFNVTDDYSED